LKYHVQRHSDKDEVNATLLTCIFLRPRQQYGGIQKSAALHEHCRQKGNRINVGIETKICRPLDSETYVTWPGKLASVINVLNHTARRQNFHIFVSSRKPSAVRCLHTLLQTKTRTVYCMETRIAPLQILTSIHGIVPNPFDATQPLQLTPTVKPESLP
jgi:hypothetical protein